MLNHRRLLTTIVSAPMTTSGVLRCFCKGIKKIRYFSKDEERTKPFITYGKKTKLAGLQEGLNIGLRTRHSFCSIYKIVIIYVNIKVKKTGGMSRPFLGHDFA